MVIQNIQNKITSTGKWFLNKSNFEPELCFTSLLSSLKYVLINLNTSEIITEGVLVGSYGNYRFNFKNGSYFDFQTQGVGAGGYNIQVFHYRYLSHFTNATLSSGEKITGLSNILKNFSEN